MCRDATNTARPQLLQHNGQVCLFIPSQNSNGDLIAGFVAVDFACKVLQRIHLFALEGKDDVTARRHSIVPDNDFLRRSVDAGKCGWTIRLDRDDEQPDFGAESKAIRQPGHVHQSN